MNNDSINFKNKIVSYDDLIDIFSKMSLDIDKYKKISKNEEMMNKTLDYNYQKWTFKDGGSNLNFTINFYNDTTIKFDNYNNFITTFNNELERIKSIYVHYYISYYKTNYEGKLDYHKNSILMYIYEDKIDTTINLDSNDNIMGELCNLIKDKSDNAKIKYDEVINKKSSIVFIIGIAIGFIPSIIICMLLLFSESIREVFSSGAVLYPICCLFMTLFFGNIIGTNKMDSLYRNIVPSKKYISYQKGYRDDISKYTNTSEVLIGNNVHNLENRNEIMSLYNKYKKFIPIEISILIVISLLVIVIK